MGILQARMLERVAMPSSRGSSQPRDRTRVSSTGRWILYHCATWEDQSSSFRLQNDLSQRRHPFHRSNPHISLLEIWHSFGDISELASNDSSSSLMDPWPLLILTKLILKRTHTAWRPSQGCGPHHKSTPMSACTWGKHLSRNPNTQSESSSWAWAWFTLKIGPATVETVSDFYLGAPNHCRWWLQPWN